MGNGGGTDGRKKDSVGEKREIIEKQNRGGEKNRYREGKMDRQMAEK